MQGEGFAGTGRNSASVNRRGVWGTQEFVNEQGRRLMARYDPRGRLTRINLGMQPRDTSGVARPMPGGFGPVAFQQYRSPIGPALPPGWVRPVDLPPQLRYASHMIGGADSLNGPGNFPYMAATPSHLLPRGTVGSYMGGT